MEAADVERLIDAHGKDVYAFCRKMAAGREDADDLYQRVFLKAWEMRAGIRADGNPKSFLLSLAVGIWKNTVRKESRRRGIVPQAAGDGAEVERARDDKPGVPEALISAEVRAQVNRAVRELPEKYRMPVVMFYTLDMPLEQIARAMKLPKGTVKSRLHKARQLMKRELEAMGYGQDD